jgi:hypothetical protein
MHRCEFFSNSNRQQTFPQRLMYTPTGSTHVTQWLKMRQINTKKVMRMEYGPAIAHCLPTTEVLSLRSRRATMTITEGPLGKINGVRNDDRMNFDFDYKALRIPSAPMLH